MGVACPLLPQLILNLIHFLSVLTSYFLSHSSTPFFLSILPLPHHRMNAITLFKSSILFIILHLISSSGVNPLPVVTSDVLAELRHCSSKSSAAVNECREEYSSDVNQYGRKGAPCCAYAKLIYCLNESLEKPCDKYISRLLDLFQADKPKDCEGIEYPSISCFITVKSNLIFGTALTALILSVTCVIYYCCKCICKCCSICRSKP